MGANFGNDIRFDHRHLHQCNFDTTKNLIQQNKKDASDEEKKEKPDH